ncbi:MAG TPA: hypothetical protein DDY21_00255 [Candidatus Moranbacteria bacterium]|nr:hypothetical protein [Candidatus Moranbacteria bacterium]
MLVAKELLLDKNNDIISSEFIDFLLKIRFNGGYFIGHIKPIKKLIVFLEDLFTLRGLRSSAFARTLHWATGNSIFYIDPVGGSDAGTGADWANAWKTITNGATAARIAPGDVIRIAKSPAPTSLGTTGAWTNLSKTITLGAVQTQTIELCETAFTASASVTATVSATMKQGSYATSLAISDSFTTGKVAYKSFAALNLSDYQKISFWFRNSTAVAAGNVLKVCLCSDTSGDTIVDTFYIPAVPSAARYLPLTITREGGGNLGASIQSIAVYADIDPGTLTLLLDDFIACTTDGLNLQSLISKNSAEQGGTEGWYGIQSINGTTVLLDTDTNTLATAGKGYSGTTETVTTYKRETIKTALASVTSMQVQVVQDSGTLGNNIQFQGGYNTANSNQDGETFFDGSNGNGCGIYLAAKSYITFNYLDVCRYNYGIYYYNNSSNNTITTLSNANNNYYGIYYDNSSNNTITTLSNANNNYYGICYNNSSNNTITTLSNANNNNYYGIYYYDNSSNNTITTLSNANNNYYYGICYNNSSSNTIRTLSTSGNGTAGIFNNTATNYFSNALIAEATEVGGYVSFANSRIFSNKHDRTAYNHWVFTDGGTINSLANDRAGGAGLKWKYSITSINRNINYSLDMVLMEIPVNANAEVTVTCYVKKDHATDVGAKLICRGGQIAGVVNDVVATKAGDTNWEQLTLTFTPTEVGVIEIEGLVWYVAGNSNVYFADITVAQA